MHNKNDLCLRGKNALVTGSSRGIGKAIAIELAKNGANIILNYNKNEKEALEIMNEIKDLDVDCIAIKADVSNFEEVKGMFNVVGKKFGKLDILVNNAGIIMDKTLQNMSIDDWNVVMKTNLKGTFNVTKNALPLLNENGRIINVSSIVALDGNFGQTNYAASKAGIIGFTKSLAKELGKYGITVNAIAPGLIETDIIKSMPSFKKEELSKSIPLGRSGTPKDVANLVVFLASDKAGYITGDVISIDGGLRF
ncbi:MAG: 3-oxoacyl-ACP reductase family protein [Nanoarchaeota archaeon]